MKIRKSFAKLIGILAIVIGSFSLHKGILIRGFILLIVGSALYFLAEEDI